MSEERTTTTQIIRERLEQACKEFTGRIAALGFARTKKMFWTRRYPFTIDFIHFHRCGSTYGGLRNFSVEFRVHFGIRVLNDSFGSVALNGPWSDVQRQRVSRYHLRFNAKSGDTYDRCLDDLTRFVLEQGEPWFQRFRSIESLLRLPDSPLSAAQKQRLVDAVAGSSNPQNEAASLKILGIK